VALATALCVATMPAESGRGGVGRRAARRPHHSPTPLAIWIDHQQIQRLVGTRRRALVQPTHTHPFNGPFSGTTRVSRYQEGKTDLDFTEARDSEWQWHQLGPVQVCTSLQTDNHASNPPLSFLEAGCPSCRPTNSVKALKASVSACQRVVNKQYKYRLSLTDPRDESDVQ